MSIVLPSKVKVKPRKRDSNMTSVAVQADVTDPEGVVGIVRSFRDQLREIQELNSSLVALRLDRDSRLQHSESKAVILEDKITELIAGAEAMEGYLQAEWNNGAVADTELEQLLKEKEHLDTELQQFQDQDAITNNDIDNEQRLLGFVEEEVATKMEDLSNLQARLRELQKEYFSEWEGYKSDIERQSRDTALYQEQADHMDELRLARYIGSVSDHKADNASSRDLYERLVAHHWNLIDYRKLNQQLIKSQILERDLENEIGTLFAQKTQLWKRSLDLEHCLDDLKDTTDDVNMLRPSSAYAALPDVANGRIPRDSGSDLQLETESLHDHGTMLHRCHKKTNIAISLDDIDITTMTNETQQTVDSGETKLNTGREHSTVSPPVIFPGKSDITPDPSADTSQQPKEDSVELEQAKITDLNPEVEHPRVQQQSPNSAQLPQTQETPQSPKSAQFQETPEIPLSLKSAQYPQAQEASKSPKSAQYSQAQETPQSPKSSHTSQAPEAPQTQETPQTPETAAPRAFDEATPNTSFISKLRRRVAGGSSSSQRIRGVPKLTATSSTKRLEQWYGGRKKR